MNALVQIIYHFQQKVEFTVSFAGHFSPFSPFWNNLKSVYLFHLLRYENLPWLKEKFKQYLSWAELLVFCQQVQTPSDHLKTKNIASEYI